MTQPAAEGEVGWQGRKATEAKGPKGCAGTQVAADDKWHLGR